MNKKMFTKQVPLRLDKLNLRLFKIYIYIYIL